MAKNKNQNRPRPKHKGLLSLIMRNKAQSGNHDHLELASDTAVQLKGIKSLNRPRPNRSSDNMQNDRSLSCDSEKVSTVERNTKSSIGSTSSLKKKQTCSNIRGLPIRKAYKPQQARNALEAIANGMSVRKAASVYNIPRTTLQDLKRGCYAPDSRPGPAAILTQTEEQLLSDWLIELARRGIPITKECLLDSVQKILQDDPRPNPFVNNRPGRSWFQAFLKRHPNVAERNAESICRARDALTEQCIRGWFADVAQFFKEQRIEYVLENPERQFNGDETGFLLDPKSGLVMAPRGSAVYTESGGLKEQITVLVTTRADGYMCTNAVVFPYKRAVPKHIVDSVPDGFCVGRSESGWMTSEIFFEYMANVFIPYLAELRRKERGMHPDEELVLSDKDWVVYWIDGYSSHLTFHTSQICDLNKVVLYCFKAHSSHVCQPNDLGPFKPLKAEWKAAVSDWRISHPYENLNRVNFAPVLSTAIVKLSKESIISGYRAAGLYPFNPDAVHYERLTATNQSKFDQRAFMELNSNEPVTAETESHMVLRHVEQILGANVVSLYTSMYSLPLVNIDDLPPINAYLVWSQLKTAVTGRNELGSRQESESIGNITVSVPESINLSLPFPADLHSSLLENGNYSVLLLDTVVQNQSQFRNSDHLVTSDDAHESSLTNKTNELSLVEHSSTKQPVAPSVSTAPAENNITSFGQAGGLLHFANNQLELMEQFPAQASSSQLELGDERAGQLEVQFSELEFMKESFDKPEEFILLKSAEERSAKLEWLYSQPDAVKDRADQLEERSSQLEERSDELEKTVQPESAEGRSGQEAENKYVLLSQDVKTSGGRTPSKIRRGIPVWFRGKVSPAFHTHLFWPSPPKKKGKQTDSSSRKELFPACASTSKWRELHQKRVSNSKTSQKDITISKKTSKSRKVATSSLTAVDQLSSTKQPAAESSLPLQPNNKLPLTEHSTNPLLRAEQTAVSVIPSVPAKHLLCHKPLTGKPDNLKRKSRESQNMSSAKCRQTGRSTTIREARKEKSDGLLQSSSDESTWTCHKCGFVYGSAGDPRISEDWLTCVVCTKIYHESCAEEDGVIDDDLQLTCQICLE